MQARTEINAGINAGINAKGAEHHPPKGVDRRRDLIARRRPSYRTRLVVTYYDIHRYTPTCHDTSTYVRLGGELPLAGIQTVTDQPVPCRKVQSDKTDYALYGSESHAETVDHVSAVPTFGQSIAGFLQVTGPF